MIVFLRYFLMLTVASFSAGAEKGKAGSVWIDPAAAAKEDVDFTIQGEYGSEKSGAAVGVQVVALGGGAFDAYVLQGGLPGLGWTREKSRRVMRGKREGEQIVFADAEKKTSATIRSATIEGGNFLLIAEDGAKSTLAKIERHSVSLGAKPPAGAVVLFDGSNTDAWDNAAVENGFLRASGATSKQQWGGYTLHLEFRTPYMPNARGQGRGNSGVYHSGRWETQVLDSFGLEGEDNECGGIYSVAKPMLNMCLPPLSWQTYDVDFTAAKFDESGKRTAWPRITVKLNGVLIHENLEIAKEFTASAPLSQPLTAPDGPVHLQNHGNPVVYRNIWITPKK